MKAVATCWVPSLPTLLHPLPWGGARWGGAQGMGGLNRLQWDSLWIKNSGLQVWAATRFASHIRLG